MMRVVAGHDRSDRGVEILRLRPLEVLRLIALPGPAAGRRAVILESAADAVVGAGARQQGVDLLDRGLGAAEPQLQHAAHRRAQASRLRAASRLSRGRGSTSSQPCVFSQSFIFSIWLIVVTAPSVISVSSASISGPAAWAILRAASANVRSTWKPRALILFESMPDLLLGVRQRRQAIIRFALDLDVLHVVIAEAVHLVRILVPIDAVRDPRPCAASAACDIMMHQPFAGRVLAMVELHRVGQQAQLGRQSEREARGLRAAMALGRNQRKAVARVQDVLLDGALERIVVRDRGPVRICRGLEPYRRNGIARKPALHRAVVDGIGDADDFRRRIGRVDGPGRPSSD